MALLPQSVGAMEPEMHWCPVLGFAYRCWSFCSAAHESGLASLKGPPVGHHHAIILPCQTAKELC